MPGEHLACTDMEDYVQGAAGAPREGAAMDHTTYGMSITTSLSLEDAEAAIRSALSEEGFGVLTEIDVAATLRQKLGIERRPYRILGACNPVLANQALTHDEHIGLLLPCNVTVAESDDGTVVSVVDPQVMLGVAGDSDEMQRLAGDAKARLERALHTLEV
jgi:uncharacterized protein (DUF302 family)